MSPKGNGALIDGRSPSISVLAVSQNRLHFVPRLVSAATVCTEHTYAVGGKSSPAGRV